LPGDVEQFEARAQRYDESTLGRRFHLPVQEAVLGIAARLAPRPEAILDVGCGTGSLLRLAADRFPTARLYGVDPAEAMVAVAAADPRLTVARASAERLSFADAGFDLILSTNSFHHWEDKAMGIAEIARVLRSGGHLVLADPSRSAGYARSPRSCASAIACGPARRSMPRSPASGWKR